VLILKFCLQVSLWILTEGPWLLLAEAMLSTVCTSVDLPVAEGGSELSSQIALNPEELNP